MVNAKLQRLEELLHGYGSCLVAYSGGVDSVFLAHVAHRCLGNKAVAVIADSPSLPRRELREALEIAQQFKIPVRVVNTAEFGDDRYLANSTNRCYFCKSALFTELIPLAKSLDLAVVVYGENASDLGDHRPGAKAAEEYLVRSPLKEAGLTKAEIRELSAAFGLPTADKPQLACLSSRIPTGEAVTPAKLRMIEEAEYALRDLGFHDVRVRHHEASGGVPVSAPASLARIEIGPSELPRLFADGLHLQVEEQLRAIGYTHVTIDLAGYRRGSTNGVSNRSVSTPVRFQTA